MNKQEILKKFKKINRVKKIFMDKVLSNNEIKSDFIYNILLNNPELKKDYVIKNIVETNKTFEFKNLFCHKSTKKQIEIINLSDFLPLQTTNIKEYDKIKGNWFKTDLCLYEVL